MTTAPPENANAPGANRGAAETTIRNRPHIVSRPPAKAQVSLAVIEKTPSSQLRVTLTEWRGQRKVEIREATATIPGCFFPTSAGVTIDLHDLPELIAALERAEGS